MTTPSERRTNDVRIAVAESRLDSHAQMLENNQELTAKLVDRLDVHIQESMKRDEGIRSELAKVSVAISENNSAVVNLTTVVGEATTAIKDISAITRDNQLDLVKIDTAWHTVAKVATIVAIAVSSAWGLGTYVLDRMDKPIATMDRK